MADLTGMLLAAAGSAGGGGGGITPWELTNATYSGDSFSVASQETIPTSLFFKPDGTKMYISGFDGDDINEYDLSTAWDITTASYVQNFSVATQESSPSGLFFKDDGTKMYVIGSISDNVLEYSLSSAWDISSASFAQAFSIASQELVPQGVFFKSDGTKMYVIGSDNDSVNEYSLSSAWNISTASYVQSFSVSSQDGAPLDIFFKPDGTKFYIVGGSNDAIYEYSLSSAWNISTASYVQSFSVSSQDTGPSGISFKDDGSKLYMVGNISDAVYSYDL